MQDANATFDKSNYIETGMPSQVGELKPDLVKEVLEEGHTLIFVCENGCRLAVTSLGGTIVRFRLAPSGHFVKDFSYALNLDSIPATQPFKREENNDYFILKTPHLHLTISKQGLRKTITQPDGTILSQDEKGFHWLDNDTFGGEIVMTSRRIQPREAFYGLGDIPGHTNLRGQRRSLWGSDVYGYGKETDPLYKNIPFFYGLTKGNVYGIFFDNSFRSLFDFGKERPAVSSFWAQGGEMNYYFISGPKINDVTARYHQLTGLPELPPLWALGFHQCKWSYKSQKEVLEIANQFKKHEIPCDVIYTDIDYMDEFRCFTWNKQPDAFPEPKALTDALAEQGIKLVAIIDPGIKVDPGYHIYDSGLLNEVFCQRMDGPLFKGSVWPGPCHFPDYTNPKVRNWWADLFPDFLHESGVAGIWTDMNEPAVFNEDKTFPRDVRHDYDGNPCSHRRGHNVYGMQMARATRDGLLRAYPDRRPFVITRSAFAGTQRYSSAWTGDIQSTWSHLRIGSVQCQRLSLSGYSFVGTDIGGFSGRSDGELFVRWLQLGIFHPFCRVHSSGDENEQEPWSFGAPYTAIAKKFIELRYRLLPYLYTTFEEHIRTAAPMLRPLIYLDQEDPECVFRMEEFGVGGSILTCPISKKGAEGRWLYLPRGEWYDFWTNQKFAGGTEMWVEVLLDSCPIYITAGSILPLSPVRMNTTDPLTHMELHLYPDNKGEATGELYEDSGEGFDYRKDNKEGLLRRKFTLTKDGDDYLLRQEQEGDFAPEYDEFQLHLSTLPKELSSVSLDQQAPQSLPEKTPLKVSATFKEIRFTSST